MKALDTKKIAMTFGLLLGGWHLVWSILIFIGVAQAVIDFVFWIHMLSVPIQVTAFTYTQSLLLIIVTFVIGYAVGWIFALVWNKIHR